MKTFCFDKEDAIKHGTEEAVILYHFRYWINTNKINNKHNYQGKHWVYNSYKGLSELFPFFNESKCRRLIESLKKQGIIEVGNFNKKGYDRTIWYTLTDNTAIATQASDDEDNGSAKPAKSISQSCQMDMADLADGSGRTSRPIPITPITSLSPPIISSKTEVFENRVDRDFKFKDKELSDLMNSILYNQTPDSFDIAFDEVLSKDSLQ